MTMEGAYPEAAVRKAVAKLLFWGRNRRVIVVANDLDIKDVNDLWHTYNAMYEAADRKPWRMYIFWLAKNYRWENEENLRLAGARIVDYEVLVRSYL